MSRSLWCVNAASMECTNIPNSKRIWYMREGQFINRVDNLKDNLPTGWTLRTIYQQGGQLGQFTNRTIYQQGGHLGQFTNRVDNLKQESNFCENDPQLKRYTKLHGDRTKNSLH